MGLKEKYGKILVMDEIREQIEQAILKLFGEGVAAEIVTEVTVAPEGQDADYASNIAMKLVGVLKKEEKLEIDGQPANPRLVGEMIKAELESAAFPFEIEVAGPGFLNFISRDGYWKEKLAEMLADFDKNISCDEYSGKTVICEFSDPNPFKVLHVGHLYTSVVGDAISRLVEFAGGKVVRANFGGDVGLHVAKTLYAMQEKGITAKDIMVRDDDADETISMDEIARRIEIIAKCYVEGTRAYEDNENAKIKITEMNRVIYAISENDLHDSELAELYWAGRELSYRYFADFYAKLGVKFNKYYPESTVAQKGLDEVKKHIPEVYEESNGAVVFIGERYGLHTRVFINQEGLPTYETKDVGLLFTKWEDYKFDTSVVITGNDIIDYMKVVLKSVSMYAPELVERTKHITHGNVKLPGNEKMSSRKGNFIKAVEVLDTVEKLVEETTGKPSDMTALAAIKYAFLKYKIGGNIEFDIEKSVSTTGNSGVYLQYSAVRAKKIIQNGTNQPENSEWKLNEYEKGLMQKLAQYKAVLEEAVVELSPHKIANYLYEVAQEFSRFYEHVKVAGSDFEAERMKIVQAYLLVMTHGLELLGIKVPEEM